MMQETQTLPEVKRRWFPELGWGGWIGLLIVVGWIALAIAAPWIAPFDPADFPSDESYDPMGSTYWLGTDYLGRDMFSRIVWGARLTIGLAFVSTLLATLVGVIMGLWAAIGGPKVDMVFSRLHEALMSIPTIMFGLVIIAGLGASIPTLIGTTAVVYSSGVFRVARALGMDLKVMDYVAVAKARGEGIGWIVRKEILPNAIMPLLTDFGLRLVFVIFFLNSLSFLGLGVQPPLADWGMMVRENLSGLASGAAAALAPACAIASLTIGINFIVDDLSAKAGGALHKEML